MGTPEMFRTVTVFAEESTVAETSEVISLAWLLMRLRHTLPIALKFLSSSGCTVPPRVQAYPPTSRYLSVTATFMNCASPDVQPSTPHPPPPPLRKPSKRRPG